MSQLAGRPLILVFEEYFVDLKSNTPLKNVGRHAGIISTAMA